MGSEGRKRGQRGNFGGCPLCCPIFLRDIMSDFRDQMAFVGFSYYGNDLSETMIPHGAMNASLLIARRWLAFILDYSLPLLK